MKVVGLHIVGPNAGEMTQGFGLAFRLGATKADFDKLLGIHPTCAEVNSGEEDQGMNLYTCMYKIFYETDTRSIRNAISSALRKTFVTDLGATERNR